MLTNIWSDCMDLLADKSLFLQDAHVRNVPLLPKYLLRQAWTNSKDPDRKPQIASYDQCLLCLPLIRQFVRNTNK